MISATIKVTSKEVDEAFAKIDNLVSQLAEPTSEVLEYLRQKMAAYPPPPAGSTYVRTEQLKGGWQGFLILAGNRLGILSNPVAHGPWVQSAQQQAWMHKGRWQTDQSVADNEADTVIRMYDEYVQRLLNG